MTDERLKQLITEYIDEHEEEMLSDLMALIRINSEKAAPESDKPYGVGAYDALMAAKSLCEHYGFTTKVYDNRVVSADMTQYAPQLDILAHMDVVPAGDGWTVCAPYTPVIRDGAIYGRGSSDDKGPAIAALYAMRAVKELGVPLSRNCRLILGSDEEAGSSDIEHYYGVQQEAPMTFSPDAEFPVINVEKGRLEGTVVWSNPQTAMSEDNALPECSDEGKAEQDADVFENGLEAEKEGETEKAPEGEIAAAHGARLISCTSGHTINIVPDKAEACIAGIKEDELREMVLKVKAGTGAEFTYDIEQSLADSDGIKHAEQHNVGESMLGDFSTESPCRKPMDEHEAKDIRTQHYEMLSLRISGAGAHASTPEKGVNALSIMLAVLGKLQYADKGFEEEISKLAVLFPYGDHDGEAVGAACEDSIAGKTTVSPDIFSANEREIILKFDARTCIKAEEPDMDSVSQIKTRVEQAGLEFKHSFVRAHAVDGSSEFVQTLLGCYEAVTGKKGSCMAVGGGTYVHELKNGVAFGAVGETTDTHMHGADEYMLISELKEAAIIYALAIAKLCR